MSDQTQAQSPPAEATAALALAMAARSMQMEIRTRLLRDVARLWPALDAKRLDETFPGWVRGMTVLVSSYHGQSAAAASVFYRSARERAVGTPTPRSFVRLAPKPSDEWMRKAFGFSGPAMLTREPVRETPLTRALSTTLGTASRIALDGGRTTIVDTVAADPVAVGWYRVTDGDPCAFCALLASRGVVYKDDSFDASDARFTGDGTAKVHNDCGCGFAPAFSRNVQLPPISEEAARVYRERGEGDALVAFRKAWNARSSRAA